ncbi:alpha/beta fold hydrolase [Actinoalloteichus hymeniacidonis]|uniref:Hydrolase or acyltransferase of alpha/beta superfamily n=1 Tax=Actinoalloteichus hymeniacidonis TaxID=340345 RepID=A0AAC9N0Q1_9PSEU|nr:alpha/beta hydrolase [Actinoalloteichus hymeniacidonis]AOS65640.1 putative hydrolase or acyltransferase of alpha/beta superfamily [Actinoalloteichus hymeniacidonis]MBB5906270.1 pimeloyl-ACP methyl ester carboxylesterase [Actinoalloteichus hymeniacidonis]
MTTDRSARADSPAVGRGQPTLVFVHGTNSSSYLGSGLVTELTLRGYRAVAVDLPGHGDEGFIPAAYQAPQDLAALAVEPSPLAGITAEDYAARVVEVVRAAREHGPVILAGASQGGVTLSRVGNLIPELIDRVVYVAAYCCVDLPTLTDYLGTPENDESLLGNVMAAMVVDPAELGVSRINWRTADPLVSQGIKDCLAADFTDAGARRLFNLLEPDEPASIPLADARGQADTWGRIPRTYVRFTLDRLIPPALQSRFIAEADRLTPDNPTDVRDVPAPHCGPFERPELVDILAELLDG